MVARRAHNPEVVRFKSHLRNQKESNPDGLLFFLLSGMSYVLRDLLCEPTSALAECRANNLQPKKKRLNIVFSTVDGTKQGVCRAECKRSVEATANDYATAAEGRDKKLNL